MKNVIFIYFILFPFVLSAQDKKVKWDYPVKPGMEEWKKFQSNQEMVDACQIPEKVLSPLSTEDLTELCLQYPLLNDIFAFDNLNSGIDKLFTDFNGIRELYKRKDVSSSLTKRYVQKIQSFSFLDEKKTELEKGYFIISVSALEALLSRIEWPDNAVTHKEILQKLVTGYEEKFKYANYFKGFGFRTNVYSRVHVISEMNIQSLEKLPQKNKNAALHSGMADEQSINVIDELSYQLIK